MFTFPSQRRLRRSVWWAGPFTVLGAITGAQGGWQAALLGALILGPGVLVALAAVETVVRTIGLFRPRERTLGVGSGGRHL
jgi:hypothetical protein